MSSRSTQSRHIASSAALGNPSQRRIDARMLISGHLLAAARRFALGCHGQIDQRFTNLVGGLHVAVTNPVDGGLLSADSRANGLLGEASSAETFDGI